MARSWKAVGESPLRRYQSLASLIALARLGYLAVFLASRSCQRKRISDIKGDEEVREGTETETETGPPTREDPGGKEEPFFLHVFFYIGSCYTVNKYYIHPTL